MHLESLALHDERGVTRIKRRLRRGGEEERHGLEISNGTAKSISQPQEESTPLTVGGDGHSASIRRSILEFTGALSSFKASCVND